MCKFLVACMVFFCMVMTLFVMPLGVKAQDKILIQKVEAVFKDVRGSERKDLVEECVKTWTSPFFSEAEKDSISEIFKDLVGYRMSVNPDLVNFAQSVNAFCQRDEKENLNVWLSGLKSVVRVKDRRKNNIKSYLATTRNIICDGVVGGAASHKWYVRGKYHWTEDADNLIAVDLREATIICKTPKDSVFIYSTRAYYGLDDNILRGNGGIVRWGNKDSITAELSGYQIDMALSEYSADSVWFHYEKKYGQPLLGVLKDNALKYVRKKDVGYPFFKSYSLKIKVDTIFSGLSFQGGIQYEGEKLSGFGTDDVPACVHVSPNDTIHMYLYSKKFSIDSARVIAGTAEMVLPYDSCQLFHPEVNFAYTAKNNLITIKRITEQSLHVPFRDDYHQILFNIEQIKWPLDSNYMEMGMNSRSGLFKARVESLNFFNDNVYDDIQGIDEQHPLNGLHKASLHFKSRTFTVGDYTEFMKKPADQLRKQIIALSYDDFLTYNSSKDEITLKQRLFDYTSARVGLKDYDNIRFDSHPKDKRTNALLDLKNFNLTIFGVEKFTISEAKDIYVEPSDKSLVMMKNRDMVFSGKLKAGMFDMYGSNLFFSYDKYTIDLTHVDSTGMYLSDKTTKKRGNKVRSLIRDVTGDIVIDKPNNKSGKKANQGFPVFNSTKESYVYFDDPDIQGGSYKRDKFYFVIQPYTLRNINNSDKFRYAFSGTLVSNVLPDIKDTLLLMNDNTLGMAYETPKNGLPLYEKGMLNSSIRLDQKGLFADGRVNMNKSNFRSNSILLLLDSMLCSTDMLNVNRVEGERPEAFGENVAIKYLRIPNNLQATSQTKPFNIYKDRVKHIGTIFVYEDLLDASGKLELKDANLTSQLFHFQANNILSDRTDLHLSSFANKNIQLNTSNVRANIDLVNNKGKFMNNAESNKAEFPSNHYQCSFKSFTWYMNEAYLNIGIEDEQELRRIWQIEDLSRMPDQGNNIFVSTDKQCDSLTFVAPLAKYNLKSGDIQCQWVNHIDLANGRFFPDEGKIFISSTGDIQEFKNGTFLCELTDKSKTLNKVNLKLKGRYTFNGGGDFDYTNEDKVKSIIHFTEIGVDTSRNIFARVDIQPDAHFNLNEGLTYKGNIFMYSRQKDLFFKGYVKLTADDMYLKHHWLKVNTFFKASDIRVPMVVENRDDKDQRIFNGLFLNVDKTIRPYASFLSSRTFFNDELLLGGKGELVWNKEDKKYVIRDTMVDRYYNLNYTPADNTVRGFGKLDVELKIPGLYQGAVGDISYDLKEEKLNMDNILYMLDFELLGKMEGIMLKDFADKKKKTISVNPSLVAKMSGIYGRWNMPAVDKQLAKNNNNIPDSLDKLIVFDSLHFEWDGQKRSYVSKGKAMLLTMLKKPVETEFDVNIEIVRRRVGDELYIYIYNEHMWYYFEYSNKSLYTLSSNEEYNLVVRNEKAEKKVIRDKEKQALYTITLCPDSKKTRFLKRMEN